MCDLVLKYIIMFFWQFMFYVVRSSSNLFFLKAKVWLKFFMKYTNNITILLDFFWKVDNVFSEKSLTKKYED